MLLNNISVKKFKENNKGSATIVALIAGVVIMAFALSLLMVAYSLYASVSRQNIQEQCRQIAESTAVSLETELSSEDNRLLEYLKEQRLLTNNDKWIPTVEEDEDEFNPTGNTLATGKEKLVMKIRMSDGKLSNYIVQVTFSYTEDGDYDDSEGDEIIDPDEDDEDDDSKVVRVLHAKIRTSRGSDEGRDYQEAVVEKDYKDIDF